MRSSPYSPSSSSSFSNKFSQLASEREEEEGEDSKEDTPPLGPWEEEEGGGKEERESERREYRKDIARKSEKERVDKKDVFEKYLFHFNFQNSATYYFPFHF